MLLPRQNFLAIGENDTEKNINRDFKKCVVMHLDAVR